jgi:valyl-tRNA synthetase
MKFSKTYEPNQYEPDIYALWEQSGAFLPKGQNHKQFSKSELTSVSKTEAKGRGRETAGVSFCIDMPPPNANGNLHIGHGLTIALEDILIRYNRLKGNNAWYIPGADHAGFETWVVYEKRLESEGKSRFDFTRDELYAKTWDFVAEQRGNMELQLRALGASCDWSALTFTLDAKVVKTVYATFEKMWHEGLIYRGKRLVNYCTKHQTAFADIEVAYKDRKTPLYYMKYGPFVLATTRPETKFGDTAVAVHPDDERYKKYVGKTIKVEGVNGEFEVKVIADPMVDPNFGTGVVKITPAHDFNDFEVGERHNLPLVQVIDKEGRMNDLAGRFAGLTVLEARQAVVEALKDKGLIIKIDENYENRVGVCYKCGTTIEPMLMDQWFVKVAPLAEKAVKALEANKIKFHPAEKKKVLINYLKNLKDWNISRQIPWGIPVPLFKNRDDPSDWIFNTEVDKEEIVIDNKTYIRDEDTLDTWFSSGQWPFITTGYTGRKFTVPLSRDFPLQADSHLHNTPKSERVGYPACQVRSGGDLTKCCEDDVARQSASEKEVRQTSAAYPLSVMETGSDLLFPWVSRMIMLGLYATGEVPFKEVYLHGMVLDGHGQKMSKSKGNVINPMEVIGEYGSDAFRLGIIASRSAGLSQAFSTSKVLAGRNLANKLWNISRLIQQMVDNDKESLPNPFSNASSPSESWILRELNSCRASLDKLLKSYRFSEAAELLYDTIWNKYADWFLESEKLYKNLPLLKTTLEHILIMLHPFAPFLTETIWQNLSWTTDLLITQKWPEKLIYDSTQASSFETIITIVQETRAVLASLEMAHRPNLTFAHDPLVDDNQLLVQFLTKLPSVTPAIAPKGLRLAVPNHELYLDITEDELKAHKSRLEARVLALGREIDTLNLRLTNPNYLKKAPKALVEETQNQLAEKESALSRLRAELEVI